MKSFLMGIASFLLALYFFLFLHDYNLNKYYFNDLKIVCEEASAAGSLFINWEEYGEGKIVFDYEEAEEAIDAVIITMLDLNPHDMSPKETSYWTSNITRDIIYYDDNPTSDSVTDPNTGLPITDPHVIVTINAGKARYRLPFLKDIPENIRSSAHSWDDRKDEY